MAGMDRSSIFEIQFATHRTPSLGSLVSGSQLKLEGTINTSSVKVNEILHSEHARSRSRSPRRIRKSPSHRDLKSIPRQPSIPKITGNPSTFDTKHETSIYIPTKHGNSGKPSPVEHPFSLPQLPKTDQDLPLFYRLPTEIQSHIFTYLPYRTLLALRLTSHHFSDRLIPLSVLTALRRNLSRQYVLAERATLNTIMKVPGIRSRFNRFWYQDPFYLSYLLWKLEQGGDNESLECFKSMEKLRCYTCLELKGAFTGDYSRKFSIRSRGLGGTRAESRMCKECMVRKTIHGFYGKWWKEGYWRDRDVVRIRKHTGKLSAGKLKERMQSSSKSSTIAKQEHGVCAKCRKECHSLFWGCAACFEKEQSRLQDTDLQNCSTKQKGRKYKLSVRKEEWKQQWYRYSGMSGSFAFRRTDSSSSPIIRACHRVLDVFHVAHVSKMRYLVGGRDFWLYRDWKKRMKEYKEEDEEREKEEDEELANSINNVGSLASASYTGNSSFTAWCVQQAEQASGASNTRLESDAQPKNTTTETDQPSKTVDKKHKCPSDMWSPYPEHPEAHPVTPSSAQVCFDQHLTQSQCHWETRCTECWRYNRPNHWYVSAIYDQLPFERLCTTCQTAVAAGRARRAKRDEWKKKQHRLLVLYGDSATDAAVLGTTTNAGKAKAARSEELELPPAVEDAVASAIAWQTITRLFAEAGYD